jgi:hypothetical protein
MINLRKNTYQYQFSVNGGDTKTSKWGIFIPAIILTVLGIGYSQYGSLFVSEEWISYGWVLIVVLGLLLCGLLLRSLSKGGFSRFLVKIDLELAEISAYDRVLSESLWTTDFYPDQLYLAEILLDLNGEEYTYPALVYAEQKLSFVEESVPYPDKTILGYADKEEIHDVLNQINQDITALYS